MSHIIIKIHLTFIFKVFIIGNQIINLIFTLFLLEFVSINECGIFFVNMDKISPIHFYFKILRLFGTPKFKMKIHLKIFKKKINHPNILNLTIY